MDTLYYALIGLAILLLAGVIYIGYKNYKISGELSSLQHRYNTLKTQIEHGVIIDENCPVIRNQPKYPSTIHIPSEPSDFSLDDTLSAHGNRDEHIIQPDEYELSQQTKTTSGGLQAIQNILTNTITNNQEDDPNQPYNYNEQSLLEESIEDYDHINIEQNDQLNTYPADNSVEDDMNQTLSESDLVEQESEQSFEIDHKLNENIDMENAEEQKPLESETELKSEQKPLEPEIELKSEQIIEALPLLILSTPDNIDEDDDSNENDELPQGLVPEINLMPDIDIPDEVFHNKHIEMDTIKSVAISGNRLNLDNITPKKTVVIKKKV
jgi:hypothetical protein